MTFPLEFRRAQAYYPIFFQKDSNTGKFFPIILLGFEQGENLFLGPEGWEPPHIPMSVLRGPFLIGYQSNPEHPDGRQAVITIDMDSPLLSTSEGGQPLFLEHGGSAPYLENLTQLLEDIQLGLEMNTAFVQALHGQRPYRERDHERNAEGWRRASATGPVHDQRGSTQRTGWRGRLRLCTEPVTCSLST
jgi:hypothetical protein